MSQPTKEPDPVAFEICVAAESDIDTLCEIDLDASRLFEAAGLTLALPDDHEFCRNERSRWLRSLISRNTLIARESDGTIVGFVATGTRDGEPYVEQLSVRLQSMRMGIGSALLTAAQERASERGGRALWLTTYGHLPWNRPFYERAGFHVEPPSRWGLEIMQESIYERRWLPSPEHRIVMRKPLGIGLTKPTAAVESATGRATSRLPS